MPLLRDLGDVHYLPGPDSVARRSAQPGTLTELEVAGRRVVVNVPASYDPDIPAGLVVFQDGAGFLDPGDDLRAGVVLDNLVHGGDIPVTLGVFVEPEPDRNAEYDAPDDRYATFLCDEVLPQVAARWAVAADPALRAICGFSSGGSAAFTAAWHRPDLFGGVVAFSASFPQVRGGDPYPQLIRATPPKPLRVFLQTAHRDLGWDEPEDNWLSHNLRVAAALLEAGYDVRLVVGDGGHDTSHAGALLPDALRWVLGQGTV